MHLAQAAQSEASIYIVTVLTVVALGVAWFQRRALVDGLTMSGGRGVAAKVVFTLLVITFAGLLANFMVRWGGDERYVNYALTFGTFALYTLFVWLVRWPPTQRL